MVTHGQCDGYAPEGGVPWCIFENICGNNVGEESEVFETCNNKLNTNSFFYRDASEAMILMMAHI